LLLYTFKPKTGGTRIRTKTTFNNLLNKKIFLFLFNKKKKSGRIFGGYISVRHKKNIDNGQTFNLNFFNLKKKSIGYIVSFFFLKKTQKYVSLLKYSDGSFFILPTTSSVYLGSLFFFIFKYTLINFIKKNSLVMTFFFFLKNSTIFSYLGFYFSKPKYCLSSGSFGQILNFMSEKKKSLILLPSGRKLVISNNSCCLLGRVSNFEKKFVITGKAGININLGIKPTVRGNAMNPIDHPHGGRTKTNKPEVSP
jgi:large subunit ribosomal protein L2